MVRRTISFRLFILQPGWLFLSVSPRARDYINNRSELWFTIDTTIDYLLKVLWSYLGESSFIMCDESETVFEHGDDHYDLSRIIQALEIFFPSSYRPRNGSGKVVIKYTTLL